MTDDLRKLHGARFDVRCKQVPNIHPLWENSKGVPLSAIVFGCRRSDGLSLVVEHCRGSMAALWLYLFARNPLTRTGFSPMIRWGCRRFNLRFLLLPCLTNTTQPVCS
uniref:Phosphoenolpyruvate carboxykinase C-terminal P-loop domain-containing protein n=1 Tax=Ditylenchus dipsaci TaxID=166011 RepID=A0A915DQG5_9BILA